MHSLSALVIIELPIILYDFNKVFNMDCEVYLMVLFVLGRVFLHFDIK